MIPDFVLQTQEIQRQLQSQIEVTMQKWQDSVAERYSKQYLEDYSTSINKYINGGEHQIGKGLNDLLTFIDAKCREMARLSGVDVGDYSGSSEVHDSYRIRQSWNTCQMGSHPGELDYGELKDIMNDRDNK